MKAIAKPSPIRSRIAHGDVAAPGWPREALEDLDARELRLYALGWGDPLPVALGEYMLVVGEPGVAIGEDLGAD